MSRRTLVELQDKSGVKYTVQRVGDRTYPDYEPWQDGDYGQLLDKVKHLEVKDGDVFVTGYPRAGNNWVFEIINMIQNQTLDYASGYMAESMLDELTEEGFEALKEKASPRILYCHFNMDSMPLQIPEKKAKVIYIVRNIKDVATSMYRFAQTLTKFIVYKGQWEDYLDIALGEGLIYGSWFDHVRQAELFKTNHPHVPFHIICFELMKTVRTVLTILGASVA